MHGYQISENFLKITPFLPRGIQKGGAKNAKNKFSAAPEDSYAARQYIAQNVGLFGSDTTGTPRIATAGEGCLHTHHIN